jgi:hypothetical protein
LPLDPEAALLPALLPREEVLLRDAEPPPREPDMLLREPDVPLREPDVLLREFEVRLLEDDAEVLRPDAPALFLVAFRAGAPAALFEPALFRAVLCREPLPADVLFLLVPAVFFAEPEPLEEREEEEPPADLARPPPLDLPPAFRAVSPLISLLKLLFCPSAVVSW